MNDKIGIEEIPGLVAVNERARDHYDGTRRTLENVMWEALKVHNPQPGEPWRVLLPWDRDVRKVTPDTSEASTSKTVAHPRV